MESVSRRLMEMRDLGLEVDPSKDEYVILCKAFRLRFFSRCPICDEHCFHHDTPSTFAQFIRCPGCGWEYTLTYLRIAEQPDSSLIAEEIVREVVGASH